jgi:hypothetical protein
MLGLLQVLFNPSPLTELPLLKIAGVINLLCAMVAADMLIRRVRREFDPKFRESDPEAWLLSIAAMYALFLIAALVWVKVRLVNPDMLALCFVILSAYYVVRISQEPGSTRNFALLGVTLGLGYLTKTYIFPFSPVFLAAAYMAGGGRSAWRKTALAAIVLLAVSAPLLVGEAANLAYTTEVAGRGEPVYKPLTLYSDPNALYYDYKPMCTDAMGFDIARWSIGLKPNLNLRDQAQAAWRNLGELFSHTAAFFLLTAAWLAALGSAHLAAAPKLRPPGIGALLMGIGMCGIGLFVPVHLEMRYIAPFVFLTILGALVFPRYQAAERAGGVHRPVLAVGAAMILFMVGMLLYGAFDQSVRGFRSIEGKLSFQQAFEEFVRLKSFLEMRGIQPGDHVALIGGRPLYGADTRSGAIPLRRPYGPKRRSRCRKGGGYQGSDRQRERLCAAQQGRVVPGPGRRGFLRQVHVTRTALQCVPRNTE